MAINLNKGESINLDKAEPNLTNLRLGVGWDAAQPQSKTIDIDCSAFVCKHNAQGEPKLISDEHFIFYNNLQCPQNAVKHSGDNRTGAGDGDDESIVINLNQVDAAAGEISLIVTMHNAEGQHFGLINNSYINLYNDDTNTLIAQYQLSEDFSGQTAIQFGSLIKEANIWNFEAIGAGYQLDLGDFVAGYQ